MSQRRAALRACYFEPELFQALPKFFLQQFGELSIFKPFSSLDNGLIIQMDITDEKLRTIVRLTHKHLGKHATNERVKYVVMKVVKKLTDETKTQPPSIK